MEDRSNLGNWVQMGGLMVPGNPYAKSREDDPGMKTWRKIAIMRVEPEIPFFIGFISIFSPFPVMNGLICNDPMVGMRPGPENVIFVAQAQHAPEMIELILVEVTDIDNPEYATVPFY